jgi:hypothetical protein
MTRAEVAQYLTTRARQLWHEGWRWDQNLEDRGEGFRTEFVAADGKRYASYYILAQYHGQGHYRRLAAQETLPIVTITDCHIEQLLEHLNVPYLRAGDMLDTAEYRLVEAVLGDEREAGSEAFRMNYIDEGLAVLTYLGASGLAKRAFCLVPLVQEDAALAKYFDAISGALDGIPGGTATLARAMEYRSVANAWLPGMPAPAGPLRLSPLKDVNDMLIADKVYRRKAREAHDGYYRLWLEALGADSRYASLRDMLPAF